MLLTVPVSDGVTAMAMKAPQPVFAPHKSLRIPFVESMLTFKGTHRMLKSVQLRELLKLILATSIAFVLQEFFIFIQVINRLFPSIDFKF
jgi:hypothetical protein